MQTSHRYCYETAQDSFPPMAWASKLAMEHKHGLIVSFNVTCAPSSLLRITRQCNWLCFTLRKETQTLSMALYLLSSAMLPTRVASKDCSMVLSSDWLNICTSPGLFDLCWSLWRFRLSGRQRTPTVDKKKGEIHCNFSRYGWLGCHHHITLGTFQDTECVYRAQRQSTSITQCPRWLMLLEVALVSSSEYP